MFPSVVVDLGVKVIPLHALVKERDALVILGLLLKRQTATVVHEVLEFVGNAGTQLRQRSLNLLLLDVVIFLVLAATWQPLPRQ